MAVAAREHETWLNALQLRDPAYVGRFVYAVTTTGVYCRPDCPSRRPRAEHVRLFAEPAEAEAAGFRACRRCRPTTPDPDADLLARVCRRLGAAEDEASPTLAELAHEAGTTPGRLQRLFRRRLGTTPAAYARAARHDRFRTLVRAGETVAEATFGAGFGSSSRLYEKAGTTLGMTPAAYRKGGAGVTLRHLIRPTALGLLLVAGTEKGLAAIRFGDSKDGLRAELAAEFPKAEIVPADACLEAWAEALLVYLEGQGRLDDLPLDIRATAFEARVHEALKAIPWGETASYAAIAEAIGAPRAHRAVARACATNPVPLVVPCHRVVPKTGGLGGYRFGSDRKRRLLELEGAVAKTKAED